MSEPDARPYPFIVIFKAHITKNSSHAVCEALRARGFEVTESWDLNIPSILVIEDA